MTEAFKKGDVVIMKSGGPPMTIDALPYSRFGYRCRWFKGAILQSDLFEEHLLIAYAPPEKK